MVTIKKDNQELEFEIPNSLFSPKGLDRGSSLLIDQLDKLNFLTALDWGCGWGAIALFMAKSNPQARIWALDAHVGAVGATKNNAEKNNLTNIRVIASDSFSQLPADLRFDLIASNPPTHMGREVVENMIEQSHSWLNNNGSLLIVVETRLKPWIIRGLNKTYGNYQILAKTNKNIVLLAQKKL